MNCSENSSPKQPRQSFPSYHPGPGADAGGWSIPKSNHPPNTKHEWLEERMTRRVPNKNCTVIFSLTRVPKIHQHDPNTKKINADNVSAWQDHNEGKDVPPFAGCCKQFKSTPDLQEHQRRCDPEPGRHLCVKCNAVCISLKTIPTHSRNDHLEDYTFSCRQCNKVYSNKSAFRKHEKTNIEHKPFKCNQCGKEFGRKCNLTNHILSHSEDRNFECSVCSKRFKTRSCLSHHKKTHSQDKLFRCYKCGKEFGKKSYLYKHILTHSEDRNFECSVCNKRFKTRQNLTQHVVTHSQDNPLMKCDQCGKEFTSKYRFNRHVMIHLKSLLYQCSFCNRRCKSPGDLSAHKLACLEVFIHNILRTGTTKIA